MSRRIVVVDADEESGLLAKGALEGAGHATWLVTDLESAWGIVAQVAPHVVVLDVGSPMPTGLELLRKLRQESATQSVPVILVSEQGDTASRIRGLKAGAQDFLAKPFDPEELGLRVEGFLRTTSSQLAGALESHSLSDLLQSLRESKKSGQLVVDTPKGLGWIELSGGELLAVTYRHLMGAEALIALLAQPAGRFRMEPGSGDVPGAGGRELGLRTMLLEYAWMVDELERRREHLPALDTSLERVAVKMPPVDETLSELPFTAVLAALGAEPEITPRELRSQLPFSPLKVDLTLAVLAQTGAISRVREASAPRRETQSQILEELRKSPLRSGVLRHAIEPEDARMLEVVIRDVLLAGGRSPLVPAEAEHGTLSAEVLLMGPDARQRLGALLARVPNSFIAGGDPGVAAAIRKGTLDRVSLTTDAGSIRLRVFTGSGSGLPASCIGVVLWVDGKSLGPEEEELCRLALMMDERRAVVLIPTRPEALSTLQEFARRDERLRVAPLPPPSMQALLRLVREPAR